VFLCPFSWTPPEHRSFTSKLGFPVRCGHAGIADEPGFAPRPQATAGHGNVECRDQSWERKAGLQRRPGAVPRTFPHPKVCRNARAPTKPAMTTATGKDSRFLSSVSQGTIIVVVPYAASLYLARVI
jgi:hypothetical protein